MVSIIVPNYNHESFLRQRLDTIFNQTFKDFEVILLDDCSTDNSVSILSEYSKRPQVSHFIVNSINSGSPFEQWKKGIQLAQGKFIWLAESDDYNSELFLERLVPFFGNNKIGIVFSSLMIVNNNQSKLYEALDEGHHNGKDLLSKKMITGNIFVNANCVLFDKTYIDMKRFPKITDFRICGDWLFWNHLLAKSNVYFVKEPLAFYRKHENATTENLYNNKLFYEEATLVSRKCINSLGDYYHHNSRAKHYYSSSVKRSNLSMTEKTTLLQMIAKRFKANTYKNLLRRFLRKLKFLNCLS